MVGESGGRWGVSGREHPKGLGCRGRQRESEGRLRRLFPRLCGQRGTLRGESHRDMNPERGWGGWGASPSRVPVSDTEAQGRLWSTKLRRSPRPGLQRPFAPARAKSQRLRGRSLALPLSSARHGSSKMSAAPRPPLSPAWPGASPLARKISAVCSAADPAGPAPQQTLTTLKLPPARHQHQSYQPPALCELL